MLVYIVLLASFALASPMTVAATQTAPHALHRTGEEVRATLPMEGADARNIAVQSFAFAVGPGSNVTVRVDSADFDPVLTVQRGTDELRDENSGPWTNAWLVVATEDADTLTILVGAQDARGGDFRLLVRDGSDTPPKGIDAVRSDGAACTEIARAAEIRGEIGRARTHWLVAGRIAYALHELSDAETAWNNVQRNCSGDDAREANLEAALTLGAIHRGLGDLARASRELEAITGPLEAFARSAANERERRLSAQWLAMLHDNLGDIERAMRGAQHAVAHYRAAADAASRSGRKDIETTTWSKLAQALEQSGDADAAEAAMTKSLASAEASGAPLLIAESLLGKARFSLHRGQPMDARSACLAALDLEQRALFRADLLGTLAAACRELGRYDEALARLDELEAFARSRSLEGYAVGLHIERGAIAWELRELEPARLELETALKLLDESGSTEQRAALLVDLALVLGEQGEAIVARERLEKAVEVAQSTGDHSVEARAWQCLGKLSEDQLELQSALAAYQHVVELGTATDDALLVGVGKTGLAYAHWLGDDADRARAFATESVALLEPLGYHEEALDARDTLARVALERGAIDEVESELAAADRLVSSQRAKSLDPFRAAGLRSRFAEWGAIEQELVRVRLANGTAKNADLGAAWQRVARWKARALLEGLHLPSSTTESDETPTLDSATALLEYVDGTDELFVYCVRDGNVRLQALGPREEVAELARAFSRLVADPRCSARELADQGRKLFERIVAPALRLLETPPSTLVIIPTADLATIPFEALVTSASNPASTPTFGALRYLIDDYLIVYAPSSQVLARLQALPPLEKRAKHLIAGYALYGADPSSAGEQQLATLRLPSASLLSLRDLPESRVEIIELARLLLQRDPEEQRAHGVRFLEVQATRSGELHLRDFDLYFGDRAGADLLRGDLSAYTHIYLAVHGLVDARDPRRSGLAFSWNERDGGLMALEEIVGLELDAQCVVLSACGTAAGRVLRGEGVQSLAAGFLRAGARSVVASLWSVEDRDAMQVLRRFEARTLDKDAVDPARALRDAKLEFLRAAEARGEAVDSAESHARAPWQWAAFIHVGAPPR